jgi:hypothetical protein
MSSNKMTEPTYLLQYLFCCRYTVNDDIIDLLEDLATKKVKCHLNNKLESYGSDYHALYVDVLKHFKMVEDAGTGDRSGRDKIKSWSSVRKKCVKDIILKNYIIEVKNNHDFDVATTTKFKRELLIGLNFKNINDKNIVIDNNKIDRIVGLHLSTNSYYWDFDIYTFH